MSEWKLTWLVVEVEILVLLVIREAGLVDLVCLDWRGNQNALCHSIQSILALEEIHEDRDGGGDGGRD
jgi:hypothetical protein